jgi:hypothetical protein
MGSSDRRVSPAWLAACFALAPFATGCPRSSSAPETDADSAAESCEHDPAGRDYRSRVEPFLTDANPPSCNGCHLSGVDLATFVRDDACASLACAASMGLVNLASPSQSPILAAVAAGVPESGVLGSSDVGRELETLQGFIEAAARCDACGNLDPGCAPATAAGMPAGVANQLGACAQADLEAVFVERVWPWTTPCADCHWREGSQVGEIYAPRWLEQEGDDAALRTMYNLLGRGDVDASAPEASWLLRKPLGRDVAAETALGRVEGLVHGGGAQLAPDSQAMQDFVAFVAVYASCGPTLP